MKDYYAILGVTPDASTEEIKRAFKNLIHTHHPDKSSSSQATERARDIIEAYKILTDEEARRRYDRVYESCFRNRQASHQEKEPAETHEPQTSVPEDPILQKWIRAAQQQAKVELDTLINHFPEAVSVAAKGVLQYAVYYVLFSIVLFIIVKFLVLG